MILRILIALTTLPGFVQGGDLLFIGSANTEGQGGIYVSEFADGILTGPEQVLTLPQKTTLEVSRDQKMLYASVASSEPAGSGELIAWRILKGGKLDETHRLDSGVDHFCSLAQSPNARLLAGTSFGLGVVSSFVLGSNGRIEKQSNRIELPRFPKGKRTLARAHDVEFSPDGRFAFVADIANNRVYSFALEESSGLWQQMGFTTSEEFVGPRHLILNQRGDVVYVLCQRGSSVTAFRHDGEGQLTEFQTISTLPPEYEGTPNHSAEVLLHPTGRFLYASNRGANSLAVFRVAADGGLTTQEIVPSGGEAPWSFVFDSLGQHLICSNLKTSNLVVFRIDPETGQLRLISESSVPEPISLALAMIPR